jgi:hypothetical protein
VLDRSTPLPDGTRVRIRLPHGSDRPALRALHERAGVPIDELALTRLLRVDPRERCALIATAWSAGTEAIVGFAAGDLGADEPDTIVLDPRYRGHLAELLAQALDRRAGRVA